MKKALSLGLLQLLCAFGVLLYSYLWPDRLIIFGFHIPYLLEAETDELKHYYPSYYWLISGLAVIAEYALLITAGVLYFTVPKLRQFFSNFLRKEDHAQLSFRKELTFPFLATLIVSLIALWFGEPISISSKYQLLLAQSFLLLNILNLFIVRFKYEAQVNILLKGFLFPSTPPYALAIIRILFFGYLLMIYKAFLIQNGGHIGVLDKVSLPGIGWLIDIIPVNPDVYAWMCYTGIFSSLMVVVGYRTRVFLILNAVTIFYVMATPNFFGKLWHYQLVIWISWIMAVSPCADVWSVDSKAGRTKRGNSSSGYGFHIRMVWLHLGLVYLFAGFHKLWSEGFNWALADSAVNLITIEWFENYDLIPQVRIDHFPMLIKAGALITILFELAYLFLLFKKWWRWLAVIGGLVMHNLIGYFMYISFFGLLQVFYLVYIPWNELLLKLGITKNSEFEKQPIPIAIRSTIAIPVFIFLANFLCGVFQINSYPFSCYPVYTDVLSDTVAYFDYRIRDVDKSRLDFREEGRLYGFRWESYSRMEYELIRQYEQEDVLDTAAVKSMWKRWQLEVPSLSEVDSVDVFVKYRYLSPDSLRGPAQPEYLLTLVD